MARPDIKRLTPLFPLVLALLSGCGGNYTALRAKPDIYPDYAALSAANVEGRDFSREVYDRGAAASVFAIHGGDIEPATARVARGIAGSDLNLYIFSGWLGGDSGKLHVSAVHFDDPAAVALSTSVQLAVSIHAQYGRGEWVCVGGANAGAARKTASDLRAAGFEAEYPCKRLPGVSPKNIVNRPEKGGVQLELTSGLLERFENSREALSKFSGSVRKSIFAVLEKK